MPIIRVVEERIRPGTLYDLLHSAQQSEQLSADLESANRSLTGLKERNAQLEKDYKKLQALYSRTSDRCCYLRGQVCDLTLELKETRRSLTDTQKRAFKAEELVRSYEAAQKGRSEETITDWPTRPKLSNYSQLLGRIRRRKRIAAKQVKYGTRTRQLEQGK